ncbi:MAG: hypothetical protein CME61_03840 [Halobacteriovoraceae bacterium]|nr:hypothetical protein [Halobacteriovoraceae bacterium]|tara:strand:- start:46 stop:690 length:645 start_codon:yes stop_codon:yes gene_type:complete
MIKLTISKSEKILWPSLGLLSFAFFESFLLILIPGFGLRVWFQNLNKSRLSGEIIDHFLYSPVTGVVLGTEDIGECSHIYIRSLPVFGDLIYSPLDGEVTSVSELEQNRLCSFFNKNFSTEITPKYKIALKNKKVPEVCFEVFKCFEPFSPESNLISGDIVKKFTPIVENSLGSVIRIRIPKEFSLIAQRGNVVIANKSIIFGYVDKEIDESRT